MKPRLPGTGSIDRTCNCCRFDDLGLMMVMMMMNYVFMSIIVFVMSCLSLSSVFVLPLSSWLALLLHVVSFTVYHKFWQNTITHSVDCCTTSMCACVCMYIYIYMYENAYQNPD